MRHLMLITLSIVVLTGCTDLFIRGPFYRHRTCQDVGDDLYSTFNECERDWYNWGMGYDDVLKWCRSTRERRGGS